MIYDAPPLASCAYAPAGDQEENCQQPPDMHNIVKTTWPFCK